MILKCYFKTRTLQVKVVVSFDFQYILKLFFIISTKKIRFQIFGVGFIFSLSLVFLLLFLLYVVALYPHRFNEPSSPVSLSSCVDDQSQSSAATLAIPSSASTSIVVVSQRWQCRQFDGESAGLFLVRRGVSGAASPSYQRFQFGVPRGS